MYELIQVSPRDYYIDCPAKIGLVEVAPGEVCLIDSGSDKEAGRKVRQILDAKKWKLKAIYNTHSNADHIGGNKYLQSQTKCKIYAPGIECDFTRHPILEPSFLYGGYPPKDLKHKFLLAQESEAEYLSEAVLPQGFELIPMPGHFFDMVGFKTSDGTVYLADCLSSRETLEKYRIGFIYDIAAYLETLERVKVLEGKLFVPAHAQAAEDISSLAQYNIDAVLEIGGEILHLCTAPISFDELLKAVFDRCGLTMNFQQHALVGSTVRSYLSWLRDCGKIQPLFEGNVLRWAAIN